MKKSKTTEKNNSRIVRKTYVLSFKQSMINDTNLLSSFTDLCVMIKNDAPFMNVKVGLKLVVNNLYPQYIEYRCLSQVNSKIILDRLANMFQSNNSIPLQTITIEATFFDIG